MQTTDWTNRNPLFQNYSERQLREIARSSKSAKDRRAARAELAHRDSLPTQEA